jgi:hypothetical protein
LVRSTVKPFFWVFSEKIVPAKKLQHDGRAAALPTNIIIHKAGDNVTAGRAVDHGKKERRRQ